MEEREYLVWLGALEKIKPEIKNEFLRISGSAKELYMLFGEDKFKDACIERRILSKSAVEEINDSRKDNWFAALYEKIRLNKINVITKIDQEYPEKLKSMGPNSENGDQSPIAFYYKGNVKLLAANWKVGIVGSRTPTETGIKVTRDIVGGLIAAGAEIVSGMAAGIDGCAHAAALSVHGFTIAVLGSGCNVCYPHGNIKVYEKIIEDGLVISEYPPDSPPLAYHFPCRNRIIAGLSDALVVTEAKTKSGSLITARMAIEAGRNVYAVPGRVNDLLSAGTNELIRDSGAMLVTSVDDILNDSFIR